MKNLRVLILLLLLIVCAIGLLRCSDKKECNTIVVLDDGEIINCKWINSYASGFSNIHKCDDTDYQIKTNNIKQVINK